jgi:molybdopterin converting factor small subunit
MPPLDVKTMTVRLHCYAQMREALGPTLDLSLTLPALESEVLDQLAQAYPLQAALIRRCRIAVDDAYLLSGEQIPQVATLDIISPVSGG